MANSKQQKINSSEVGATSSIMNEVESSQQRKPSILPETVTENARVEINKKIVAYEVDKPQQKLKKEPSLSQKKSHYKEAATDGADIIYMHEKIKRPDELEGSSYKIKTPLSDHALYVTINDIVLNDGTEHEIRRPFEIFINSKNMDHFQWIVALTRIISAVFRKGGDATFLVDELRSVFDPHGGYFKKGGKYMPSLVAEIGDVIERHMKNIGMIENVQLDKHQQEYIANKLKNVQSQEQIVASHETQDDGTFPHESQLCKKCQTKAVMRLDGCLTCLNCGDSKCG